MLDREFRVCNFGEKLVDKKVVRHRWDISKKQENEKATIQEFEELGSSSFKRRFPLRIEGG